MGELVLESTAFSEGGEIPRKHGYKNGNVSPPLKIDGVPSEAQSLVLIMDDPDAQVAVGRLWVHWVVWNIDPNTTEIPESAVPTGAIEGTTDFGEIGYGGPAPPDKRHTYIFKLYALNTKLDLPQTSTKADVEKAMKEHVLEQTILKGTYAPS